MTELPCPGLFPLPTLSFPTKPTTRNRKSQRRYAVSSKKISLANGVIKGLNDLHSTSPTDQKKENPSVPPSLLQQRALGSIQDSCSRYFGCVDPDKSRDLLDEVWAPKAYLQDINDLNAQAYSDITQAVPVVADQVSLPTVTAKVRLLDHLPQDKAYLLQCPRKEMFRPPEEVKSAQVCHLASKAEYIKLLKRMMAVNMLTFTQDPKCVLGFFCVTKPDGSLRLILDCRKLNGLMVPPPKTELPSPEYVAQLEAPPGAPIYMMRVTISRTTTTLFGWKSGFTHILLHRLCWRRILGWKKSTVKVRKFGHAALLFLWVGIALLNWHNRLTST